MDFISYYLLQSAENDIYLLSALCKDIYSDLQATRSADDTLVQQTLADLVQLYQAVGEEEKASYYSEMLR
jgi:hypothetical protein